MERSSPPSHHLVLSDKAFTHPLVILVTTDASAGCGCGKMKWHTVERSNLACSDVSSLGILMSVRAVGILDNIRDGSQRAECRLCSSFWALNSERSFAYGQRQHRESTAVPSGGGKNVLIIMEHYLYGSRLRRPMPSWRCLSRRAYSSCRRARPQILTVGHRR